jgi:hypothetical protein
MPDTDVDNVLVISVASGHVSASKSWVLGRLVRDLNDQLDDRMIDETARLAPS